MVLEKACSSSRADSFSATSMRSWRTVASSSRRERPTAKDPKQPDPSCAASSSSSVTTSPGSLDARREDGNDGSLRGGAHSESSLIASVAARSSCTSTSVSSLSKSSSYSSTLAKLASRSEGEGSPPPPHAPPHKPLGTLGGLRTPPRKQAFHSSSERLTGSATGEASGVGDGSASPVGRSRDGFLNAVGRGGGVDCDEARCRACGGKDCGAGCGGCGAGGGAAGGGSGRGGGIEIDTWDVGEGSCEDRGCSDGGCRRFDG
mmetsp:Transcript_31784/g.94467  ORF Transcript_31784/g.94467 Transcript_31784/m.94467 type:complete len:261 (-) Transcript_31784:1545-2327(-)